MEDEDEDDDGRHLVGKTRLKHLLSDQEKVTRVRYAVETMHEVVRRGLVFGKLLYLHAMEIALAANNQQFDATVATRMSDDFPIDTEQMEEWLDVVSSSIERRRGAPYAESRIQHLRRLHAFYDEFASRGDLPVDKLACTNLSCSKGHAAEQMRVNYRNNVHAHFDKYVKRYVRNQLTQTTREEHDIEEDARIPRDARVALEADIRAINSFLLEQTVEPPKFCEDLYPWVNAFQSMLVPPAPSTVGNPYWRFESQKKSPHLWLPYMVWINRMIEEGGGKKLYSPLPQRTSLVPSHVRIDTTGLNDLLVADADATLVMKLMLEDMPFDAETSLQVKYDLPGLMSPSKKEGSEPRARKGQLFVDLSKLIARSLLHRVQEDPAKHAVAFKTAMWRCHTKLGMNENVPLEYQDLVFNNIIDTDGYSVSLHYVSRSLHGLTRFNGGFKQIRTCQKQQRKTEKSKGATYVTAVSEEERRALLADDTIKKVSVDPGKGNIATATDGTGRVIAYSSSQRWFESGLKEHSKERKRLLAVRTNTEPTAGELQRSIGVVPGQPDVIRSSKSCILQHFEEYLVSRNAVAAPLTRFYARAVFRAQRYDAHVRRRASEDRFFLRMKEAFGSNAAILIGDWGRNPNLKHQAPSPGVGFRRRMCSYFKVYLVHESYTSSVCPRCNSYGLSKPRRNPEGGEVHHVLKCGNTACSCRWWHRDVLGALNILKTGKHALSTGMWDPTFSANERAAQAA